MNDRPPEFAAPWSQENPEVEVSLNEEVPIGTVVGNFEATDPDSASVAKYEISPDSEYFEINNATGKILISLFHCISKINILKQEDVMYL